MPRQKKTNVNAQKITSFFKQTKNSEIEESDSVVDFGTAAEQFYKQQLENKEKKCSRQSCIDIKAMLQKQIDEMEMKYKSHKDTAEICSVVVSEKNREIENLQKLLGCEESATCSNPQELNIINFSDSFTIDQLSKLRLIGKTKSEDSTFVLFIVNCLYEGRHDVLQTKSLTGRTKAGQKKDIMTPEKVNVIEKIFAERLHNIAKNEEEKTTRKKNLNRLIKYAQSNISRKVNSAARPLTL